ncbi:hypothetical protein [Klugiella xanthotipulae]|nr:hypothetical protein [Klugiella xanthotipulae]
MDILHTIFLILHFIGIGSLLGGFIVQLKQLKSHTAVVNMAMFHGSLTMLVSGLALLTINEMDPAATVDHMKIGVKLLALVVIVVLVMMNRKKSTPPAWVVPTIGGLTTLNIILAVAWQ